MEVSTCSPLSVNSRCLFANQPPPPRHRLPPLQYVNPMSSFFNISMISHKVQFFHSNYTSNNNNCNPICARKRRKIIPISSVFERFTERAVKAVIFSQREAKSLGKDMVFTQHLLLGLIAEDRHPNGFLESGITIDKAREAVVSIWHSTNNQDTDAAAAQGKPFSSAAKMPGYNFIAPEHIALGLFTVDDGSAGRVLKRYFLKLRGMFCDNWISLLGSALEQFCVDLTARAKTEIQRIIQILCRRTKNNPILLGESGVGKTAIAEGLAIRIVQAEVPSKRIMSLDMGLLMAGAKERGELEARVTTLISEIQKSGDVILFIDEVHTLIGSGTVGRGNKGTGLDISNLLKPSLGRGELQCIASTTQDEYRTQFEKDKALARRFQPVLISEPSQEDAVRILLGLREKYEAHHNCKFTLEAINAAVYLPDKAIDLVDEAGSRAHIEPAVVGPDDIAAVASLWSGIPVQQITADERMLLVGLEEQLKKRVIGQDEAVAAISRAVKRSRVGLKDPNRPTAAMLFCGPTGVGKTELAKSLAACYFGSESSMLRLDMSEYMERHTVSKLIGSPPGYVGYEEGGLLTEAIRRQPFTLLLLDEIEKAHPDIFNILLQVFEDGHLTDSHGRRVSFKNALIVMTSNVGSTTIAKGRHGSIGFLLEDNESTSYAGMKTLVVEELKAYFRPELLNRIDEVVVFRSLEKAQILEILSLMLQEVKARLISLGIGLEVSDSIKDFICQQGYDQAYGARPLRRAVTSIIEDLLSEAVLAGDYKPGDTAIIDLDASGKPYVRNRSDNSAKLSDTTSIF
ncbi:Chaperone protein ClpD [Citrus sinensis]|uniref:Chaperone protein ClpD n=1 Tax=Citrus sinensis TaxID=2711 RepID=A0ACB8LAQ1_CITSI|nr:Chaperone protein ClpD [Citrus sinensis]